MKLVINIFTSEGLYEKHVVANWNVGNPLRISLRTQETTKTQIQEQ